MAISRRRLAEKLKEMHGIKKRHVKGVQNFCFCHLSMQILWRRRCSRVVDLKLPDVQERELVFEIIKQIQIFVLFLYDLWPRWICDVERETR